VAEDLRRGAIGAPRTGNIRVVHSVGGRIADAIAAAADGLGGATGVTVVSPYFDRRGDALRLLAQDLNLSTIAVHVHPKGPVRGSFGLNWPGALDGLVVPVRVDDDCVTVDRALHAKAFEVTCRRGRILVSGSANASTAALYTGNVEASVLRIQRGTHVGWTRSDVAHPRWPEPELSDDEESNPDGDRGVLRAVLDAGSIRGLIIKPPMSGTAALFCVVSSSKIDLGLVTLGKDGSFDAPAFELEALSWSGGRLIVRIEQGLRCAEGFLSVTAAAEIIRRAGVLASRLMAMLAGTETPADVAAILAWFKEDPSRLDAADPRAGAGKPSSSKDTAPVFVPLPLGRPVGHSTSEDRPSGMAGDPAWHRALSMVMSAFRVRRGPWEEAHGRDDEADEEGGNEETPEERQQRRDDADAARRRGFDAFGELLDVMLAPENSGKHVAAALAIAHYLSERNGDPEMTEMWLRRIVPAARRSESETDPMLLTAALAMFSRNRERGAISCRRYLFGLGIDPNDVRAEAEAAPAFASIVEHGADLSEFLSEIASVRTAGEQVRSYLDCFGSPAPPGFPILRETVEWPRLARALLEPRGREGLRVHAKTPTACPDCNIAFPRAKIEDLRRYGVTQCCRVNLSTEI
jgi:hypothetical protein